MACAAGDAPKTFEPSTTRGGAGGSRGGGPGAGGRAGGRAGAATEKGGAGGSSTLIELGGSGGAAPTVDPTTCKGAAEQKSYVGCDFWPTVTVNSVWEVFDYAVVVANAGEQPADVVVTRNGDEIAVDSVPPNELRTIYLPWVKELKGGEGDTCGNAPIPTKSTVSRGGAYHLVTTSPVTVYQFNALEYAPKGGPEGKSWKACPGSKVCKTAGSAIGCFSYSNDAALLLPSTAMTGNYRVATMKTMTLLDAKKKPVPVGGGFFSITATQPGTTVTVQLGAKSAVIAGDEVTEAAGGETLTLELDQGDVAQIIGKNAAEADVSGSLVQANQPIQVIAGMACVQLPFAAPACDHVESSVYPIETLGKHYIVTRPTGPNGKPAPHIVRIYGNVDGTALTFTGGAPPGTPKTIDAGQVIELDGGQGDGIVRGEFELVGDHEFTVGIFMLGGSVVDPKGPLDPVPSKGDPSQSFATAVEQYRTKYVFLAPTDYDKSFVDIVQPLDATVTLDGKTLTVDVTKIPGSAAFGVVRVPLGPGQNGAHVLEATAPVGIQVMGYGSYTSYQYPGGSNFAFIAPPPPPPK